MKSGGGARRPFAWTARATREARMLERERERVRAESEEDRRRGVEDGKLMALVSANRMKVGRREAYTVLATERDYRQDGEPCEHGAPFVVTKQAGGAVGVRIFLPVPSNRVRTTYEEREFTRMVTELAARHAADILREYYAKTADIVGVEWK